MKQFKLLILFAFIALFSCALTAQELPMRPQGGEHVTGLILRQTQGLQTGDWVFTYYEQGKTKYMTGKQEVSEIHKDNGMVISALNSNQPEHPNGNPIGVVVKAGLWRDGDMFELNPLAIYQYTGKPNMQDERQVKQATAGALTIYYFYQSQIGNAISDLKEVPYFTWYYSQCPALKQSTIDAGEVIITDKVSISAFNPSFCKSFTRQIIKGTGKIVMVNTYIPYYVIGTGDQEEVIIRIKTIPFDNCNEDQVIFDCKIKLKKPAVVVTDLSKSKFDLLMKYCFDVSKENGKIKACWTDKRWDEELPKFKIEVWTHRPGFWKSEIVETRYTNDPRPCETFTIPPNFTYLKVTAVDYGYTKIYR